MRACLLSLALGLAGAAQAEVAVTVYNQDLGVVRETRSFELPKGEGLLRFRDVASQIDPTSVSLSGPEGFKVLEQSYDYDLVSSDKLLQKYLGLRLSGFDKNGKPYEGTLLSFDGGQVVLGDAKGGAMMLSRAELTRLDFPELPGGLLSRPTLSWKVRAAKAESRDLALTYMSTGLSWHAEYVAVVAEDEKHLDLTGWVSLENNCGASFKDAQLKLVAGQVNRAPEPRMLRKELMSMAAAPMAANDGFAEKGFFEYHLYTLGHRLDLKDQQVKQVELLKASQVPVKKVYTYAGQEDAKRVKVELEFENKESQGLGLPLPAGKLKAYKADTDGSLQFIGEDAVDHTPKDEKLRVELGKSFDVVGERKELALRKISDKVYEQSVEIKLRNHRKEAVDVVVVEKAWGDWQLTQSEPAGRKKDAQTLEFSVSLPADAERTVSYTLRAQR